MQEVTTIHPYPPHITIITIRVDKPNQNNYIKTEDLAEHYSCEVRCQFFYWKYKKWILFALFMLCAGIVGLAIAVSNLKNTNTGTTNPCSTYRDDDFASGVTLDCLQALWTNSNCKGIIPNGYMGWWLQSPDGGKTVLCIPPNIGNRCGAGNFGAIRNYIYVCDLNYRGY